MKLIKAFSILNSNQSGQVIVVLLLTMLVGLAIGLAVTQRSLTDVSTSTDSEQASRAFSAAEAGLEKALLSESTGVAFSGASPIPDLGNEASTTINPAYSLPRANQAFEFPEVGKESPAQFWLADPAFTPPKIMSPPINQVEVYFGNDDAGTDTPAVEINIITENPANTFLSTRYRFDPLGRDNGFTVPSGCDNLSTTGLINTTKSKDAIATTADRRFKCMVTIGGASPYSMPAGNKILMLVRILYSNSAQRVAVKPISSSLPPQASIYTSIGSAGKSQKVLQLERIKYVVPSFLDYAIFSAGDITK